ncbi:GGDEF domain-containing protein [Hydrogenovibrio kuenenii]|uniref:GGDEF domain-containing protein n=1 Tax=Hydrogenovibrio kuenenii TaxID=63658 RepID=UPI0004656CE8|nr:diguanylate cyclase [Hydrogenovibrio kuenenii]
MKGLMHSEFRVRLLFAIHLSFLAFFSILSFIHHKYVIVTVLLLFFAVLVGLLWSIKHFGMTLWVKWLYIVIVWPFVLFLVIDGGYQDTGYLWSIPIFISTLHVAGFFIGFFASILYLFSIMFLAFAGYVDYGIPDRFYAVSFAVILLSSIHEYLVDRQSKELTDNIEAKQKQSETDPLTGLLNRRFIDEKMSMWNQALNDESKALMIVDIDHFKDVNDTLGHAEGDRILREVAKAIASVVRPNDVIGRWGGDEFVVFLEQVHESDLEAVCNRLLSKVQTIKLSPEETITVSIGAVTASNNFHKMFKEADKLLYAAKQNGRNQFLVRLL